MLIIPHKQIIDVTEQCTFEWIQKPSPCKAYLEVGDASGDFTEGETIQGQTSGATATVFSSYVDGSRVYVENISGTFQEGETIQGQSSGQTAIVDGVVPERSWDSTPNNITHGTFPDSIVSKDIDDYLEWESSLKGAGYAAELRIYVPEYGIYSVPAVLGVGNRIDVFVVPRQFRWRVEPTYSAFECLGLAYDTPGEFDRYIGAAAQPSMIPVFPQQRFLFQFYQSGKGTFRWRIHSIRVFKILV